MRSRDRVVGIDPPTHPDPRIAALCELHAAHSKVATSLAYRIVGNLADADDIVQEAFLSVFRGWDTYDSQIASLRTWLLSTVRHRAIDLLRSRRTRSHGYLEDMQGIPDQTDAAMTAAQAVDAEGLLGLLECLSREQQQVLELAYYGGFSHAEIAGMLQVPVGTVKGRIRLALNRLRESAYLHNWPPSAAVAA